MVKLRGGGFARGSGGFRGVGGGGGGTSVSAASIFISGGTITHNTTTTLTMTDSQPAVSFLSNPGTLVDLPNNRLVIPAGIAFASASVYVSMTRASQSGYADITTAQFDLQLDIAVDGALTPVIRRMPLDGWQAVNDFVDVAASHAAFAVSEGEILTCRFRHDNSESKDLVISSGLFTVQLW